MAADDAVKHLIDVDIIPPTMLPPLLSILTDCGLGIDTISIVVHSRPLAKKTKLVIGRR